MWSLSRIKVGYQFAVLCFLLASLTPCVQAKSSYQVCFTPGAHCAKLLVKYINAAKKSIYVQAYSFTSRSIGRALLHAKDQGVDVNVIVDKSQYQCQNYSYARQLLTQGIPMWVDVDPSIAHNKVMIIDRQIVETGSYNFTVSAEKYNAENMLIIHDAKLAKRYLDNWFSRQKLSLPVISDPCHYNKKH